MNNAPIGIFDSGLGGLTVARAIIDQLPGESVVYIGDTANSPYGTKSADKVRELPLKVMDALVAKGVKMLVIACNTASAVSVFAARSKYRDRAIPVLEVISPAVHRAVSATRNGKIGVIATETTIKTGTYQRALDAFAPVQVTAQACPAFVDFVENGVTSGAELLAKAREYLDPVRAAGVDTLVLGCTHYPLLTGVISYVMGPGVTLVSSAEETAHDVYRNLVEHDSLHLATSEKCADIQTPRYQFMATGDTQVFTNLARRFLGPEVDHVERV